MSQPAHPLWLVDWLADSDGVFFFFLFVVHGFQQSLLDSIKRYTSHDLGLVSHFVICFVMVFCAFAAKPLLM